MASLDNVLKKNTADLNKELEVERVIRAFKLNPYDVLDVPYTATEPDIKKTFRKKSLLIHPDKYQHERGPEAFDLLKKAEQQLSDPISRKEIDSMVKHARSRVLKVLIPVGSEKVTDDDERLQNLTPSLDLQIRAKVREVMVEEELAKRKKQTVQFANEGAEKARLEAEVAARKRKAEDHAKWEERREERVQGWRQYQKKPKKEKKNSHVLG